MISRNRLKTLNFLILAIFLLLYTDFPYLYACLYVLVGHSISVKVKYAGDNL